MSVHRGPVLDHTLEHVMTVSALRFPQRESLKRIHNIVRNLDRPLSTVSRRNLAVAARELEPDWNFPSDIVRLTFSLATGVGKTRLMGAIAAYLFRANESRNFVILAPRDAILRKLIAEAQSTHKKYIFGDPALVPQPRLCTKANLLEFDPSVTDDPFANGPNLFILSPQLLSTEAGRISRVSPTSGTSILSFLKGAEDLVVFVDESHHLSDVAADERSWREALTSLEPKLVCEMTATPRPSANVVFEYDLRRALRDRLYTKAPRLIVDANANQIDPDEYDQFTLDAGLARLAEKARAIAAHRQHNPSFPPVTPVMLVCASSQQHADQVHDWLRDRRGLREEEILVIHARRKSEQDLSRLAAIETEGSSVRVVVQVHVLDEGWDVSNVYVIAALRNVQSFTNARQVMGRGLRLPLGERTGVQEVDTLDVLAFGNETVDEVLRQAHDAFGVDAGVRVIANGSSGGVGEGDERTHDDEAETEWDDGMTASVVHRIRFALPEIEMIPPEPDLADLEVSASPQNSRTSIDLSTLTTAVVNGDFALGREEFLRVSSWAVLENFAELSPPIHLADLRAILEEAIGPDTTVAFDPFLAARLVVSELEAQYVLLSPEYRPTGELREFISLPAELKVPTGFGPVPKADAITWEKRTHWRRPIGGWNRSVHDVARFDSAPEFDLACRLDRMEGITWLRNDPRQFTIETMARSARRYSPDFLVMHDVEGRKQVLIVEVKAEVLFAGAGSTAGTHARDLAMWARTANEVLGYEAFRTSTLLGHMVAACSTITDIINNDAT